MNCQHCSATLDENTRFCPRCGSPNITTSNPISEKVAELPAVDFHNDRREGSETNKIEPPIQAAELPTIPVPLESIPHPELMTDEDKPTRESHSKLLLSTLDHSEPLLDYKLNATTKGSKMFPAVVDPAYQKRKRRRRNPLGCLAGCLTMIVIVLIIIGIGWVFVVRPYVHNIAENELNKALTQATDQPIPPQIQELPSGSVLPVQDSTINNLIVLQLAPSNPVQNPATTIDPQGVHLNFKLYGYPSGITFTPTKNASGQIVADNVSTSGVFSLVMSSDEMKSLLDSHLATLQNKLGRSITRIQLTDHVLNVTVG